MSWQAIDHSEKIELKRFLFCDHGGFLTVYSLFPHLGYFLALPSPSFANLAYCSDCSGQVSVSVKKNLWNSLDFVLGFELPIDHEASKQITELIPSQGFQEALMSLALF